MDLGEKLRQARLEAGLSQRQLCGNTITRNMLSKIENGSARPSMDTLHILAQRLGKNVSYFLDEQAVTSPNLACMQAARDALSRGDGEAVLEALESFRDGDTVFHEERCLLLYLAYLSMAQQAIAHHRIPYAQSLLSKAQALTGIYITPQLRNAQLLLLGQAGKKVALHADDTLLVMAQNAPSHRRALEILGAVEDKSTPQFRQLQADVLFNLGDYAAAAAQYETLEESAAIYARLEACWRELGDYKRAYTYACRLRSSGQP